MVEKYFRLMCCPDEDGLKKHLFEIIGKDLEKVRRGEAGEGVDQVLLIVPAQFTLEAEKTAFELLGGPGFFDFHIMSGNKLRHDILRETGGPGKTAVNGIGRSMLLRRVAEEKAESLTVFRSVCRRPEFLDLAGDFIVQLKQNRLGGADLRGIYGDLPEGSLLRSKLADMEQIVTSYEELMAGRFTDSEGLLQYTAEKAALCRLVKRSIIWYYDFYSFTPNETAFMGSLMKNSAGLGVALLHSSDEDDGHFAVTRRTVKRLKDEAESLDIPTELVFNENAEMPHKAERTLRLVRCSTPHTQALTIGCEVLELMRSGRASADEIAILTGDMEGCGSEIRRVFTRLDIPLFMDEKRSIRHDPAVGMVSALLDMSAEGLRRDKVISFLKSGFAEGVLPLEPALSAADIDSFENYTKLYHINKERFEKPLKYGAKAAGEADFARFEQIRAALAALLCPFLAEMDAAAAVGEKTAVLCGFLAEKVRLPQQLDAAGISLEEYGLAEASGEATQIWSILSSVMDQAVELIGDEEISSADFRRLLEDAFGDVKVGLLPQEEGRVTLGTVRRSKLSNIKALFVAGANEGQIPSSQNGEALLTEDELSSLEADGYVLNKSCSILAEEEDLNIERALNAPSDLLWIGYCAEDAAAGALRPSSIVLDMIAGGVSPENDIENSGNAEKYLTGPRASAMQLGRELLAYTSGEKSDIAPVWRQTYNLLLDRDPSAIASMAEGLLYENRPMPLQPDTVKSLFAESAKSEEGRPDSFAYSASQLENYASCPFRHFISYGIKPDEPRELGISGLEIGDIYHECLMKLCEELNLPCRRQGIAVTDPASPWMTVTKGKVSASVNAIMDSMEKNALEGLMSDSAAEKYRSERLRSVALRFAWQMVLQVRRGNIDTMQVETPFGYNEAPAVTVDTPIGKVRIVGRIDRLDRTGKYVKIIDYKSGSKVFDRREAEEGYALQLMVYLESALASDSSAEPAGMFYYLISDGSGECSLEDISSDEISEEILAKIENDYMLNGVYIGEDEIVSTMDTSAVSAGCSAVIDYRTKEDHSISSKSALTREDFTALRISFRNSLERLVGELNRGRIDPDPHRKGQTSACSWCQYRGICIFDPQLCGKQ